MASDDSPPSTDRVPESPSDRLHLENQAIEEISSSSETDEDLLIHEKRRLRRHLGLGENPGDSPSDPPEILPLFFIEKAPDSRNGAKCKLPICAGRIVPGELRLAVNPAMGYGGWHKNSAGNREFLFYINFLLLSNQPEIGVEVDSSRLQTSTMYIALKRLPISPKDASTNYYSLLHDKPEKSAV